MVRWKNYLMELSLREIQFDQVRWVFQKPLSVLQLSQSTQNHDTVFFRTEGEEEIHRTKLESAAASMGAANSRSLGSEETIPDYSLVDHLKHREPIALKAARLD